MDDLMARLRHLLVRGRSPVVFLACMIVMISIFWLALVDYQKPTPADDAIEIVAGVVPPNFNEDGSGREADIIKTALQLGEKSAGAKPRPVRIHAEPFGKHWYSYKTDERYDAVATVPENVDLGGHRSSPYIIYRNGIGVAEDSEAANPLDSLQRLAGRRVISFAGAARVIPELGGLVHTGAFKVYLEREDQRTHSWMLLNGRVDAVIADAMIFAEFNARLFNEGKAKPRPMHFHAQGFPATCYALVFRNGAIKDLFEQGLKEMIAGGQLYDIDQKYVTDQIKAWKVQYIANKGAAPCLQSPPS